MVNTYHNNRSFEPRHEKICLYHMRSLHSLISAFVFRCLDNIIPLVSVSEISGLYLTFVPEQASLSLTWLQTLKTGFLVMRLISDQWHRGIASKPHKTQYEPSHEIIALFILCKLMLQTRMRSHPVGLDVWFLVGRLVYFHTSCVPTGKALVRLCGCAGSSEPSLVAYVISTIISWAGAYMPEPNTPEPLNNTVCYTTVLDITRIRFGPQMAI